MLPTIVLNQDDTLHEKSARLFLSTLENGTEQKRIVRIINKDHAPKSLLVRHEKMTIAKEIIT